MSSQRSHASSSSSRRRESRGNQHRGHHHGSGHRTAGNTKVVFWYCHRCGQDNVWNHTTQCINHECQHHYCDLCALEEHEVRSETSYSRDQQYQPHQQYQYGQ